MRYSFTISKPSAGIIVIAVAVTGCSVFTLPALGSAAATIKSGSGLILSSEHTQDPPLIATTSRPFPSANRQPVPDDFIDSERLFPPVPEVERPAKQKKKTSPEESDKTVNRGTIEFDEHSSLPLAEQQLSAVQALTEALVKGPRASAVRAQLAIARANFPAATQQPNPILLFDRGLMAEQVNRLGPLITFDPPWNLLFRLLIANRLVAQTKIDLLTALWSLRAEVRRAYVELVLAQETQVTLEQTHKLTSRLLAVATKRFQAGAVAELDVFKASLAASQAEVEVSIGQKRVLRAKRALNILMGRPPESPLVAPSLPDYTSTKVGVKLEQKSELLPNFDKEEAPLTEFIDRALENRFELKSLGLQVKVNKANLVNAYSNIIPDPKFTFGKSTAGNPNAGPKLTAVFMTLNAECPTADFNQGPIYQYRATQNLLRYQIPAQINQVKIDVSSAYNNLIAARKKIRVYQDCLLSESNEVARLSRRSYEVGQSDLTAALIAQQANVQTRNAYVDAIYAYAAAFTDLEHAVGKPLQ